MHTIYPRGSCWISRKNPHLCCPIDFKQSLSGTVIAKLSWCKYIIALFEKAIELNPANDDLKVGLGSCYIFGKGRSGSPEETMKGIQQLLSVVRKDSNNMKAQMMLGVGGYIQD